MIITILKAIPVLAATMILGNWFLSEVKKAKIRRLPWYRPYMTLPGVIVIVAVMLPIVYWLVMHHH